MRKIEIVNGPDRSWARHRYILWFGTMSTNYLMVWANGLENAIEFAGEWLAYNAPRHIITNSVEECYQGGIADGMTENDARECSERDATYTESGWLDSSEWGLIAEDPSREAVLQLIEQSY